MTIANEYHWPPHLIGGLFFDELDELGLWFWYKEVEAQVKDSKEKFKDAGK